LGFGISEKLKEDLPILFKMSNSIIKAEGIGKRYVLFHEKKERYMTLRDMLSTGFKKSSSTVKSEFWALNDVSFDVQPGDRIGIIGRNGAGKSTLLKILSRIVEPTKGRIEINGRLASLLEVGTGFHAELSGRENVFLNGSMLGMTKSEIARKFDEIVDFAEVEKFIDTPVKRYSSGMYVRLAFAVAAHLEPEILVVDEVLAVGDSAFQKKCLGKMEDVAGQGRTILFVSHYMETVLRLCNKGLLLEQGKLITSGKASDVVKTYMKSDSGNSAKRSYLNHPAPPGNDVVVLRNVDVRDANGEIKDTYDITGDIFVSMEYEVLKDGDVFTHSYNFFNEEGINIFNTHDTVSDLRTIKREKGIYTTTMKVPGNLLSEGGVSVGVAIISIDPFSIYFHELDAVSFTVIDYMRGDSARGKYTLGFPGMVRPLCEWKTNLL
jgi:lipopolysaccharide transport system ATP-binding protein